MESNNAKLREALVDAKEWLIKCLDGDNCPTEDDIRHAIDGIEATLAASARNCDVGTAEEQDARFMDFCHSHCEEVEEDGTKYKACKDDCPLRKVHVPCYPHWLHLPYEEGGNDGK